MSSVNAAVRSDGHRVIRVIRTVIFRCLLFADKIGRALIQIGQTDLARPIGRHRLGGAGAPVGHRKDCTHQSRGSKLVRDVQKDLCLFGIDLVQLRVAAVLLFHFCIQILLHGGVVVGG